MSSPSWLEPALGGIDAANSLDPATIEVDGQMGPKELLHAQRMTLWLERLDPDATPAQRLAARAHHFERWRFPRSEYPEGRAGYLRWRTNAKAQHSADVAALLERYEVPGDTIAEVAEIISKATLRTNPRAQTHEDALCLTFFELQGLDTAVQLGDKTTSVVAKTLNKMSEHGREALAQAVLHPAVREVVNAEMAALAYDHEAHDHEAHNDGGTAL